MVFKDSLRAPTVSLRRFTYHLLRVPAISHGYALQHIATFCHHADLSVTQLRRPSLLQDQQRKHSSSREVELGTQEGNARTNRKYVRLTVYKLGAGSLAEQGKKESNVQAVFRI